MTAPICMALPGGSAFGTEYASAAAELIWLLGAAQAGAWQAPSAEQCDGGLPVPMVPGTWDLDLDNQSGPGEPGRGGDDGSQRGSH